MKQIDKIILNQSTNNLNEKIAKDHKIDFVIQSLERSIKRDVIAKEDAINKIDYYTNKKLFNGFYMKSLIKSLIVQLVIAALMVATFYIAISISLVAALFAMLPITLFEFIYSQILRNDRTKKHEIVNELGEFTASKEDQIAKKTEKIRRLEELKISNNKQITELNFKIKQLETKLAKEERPLLEIISDKVKRLIKINK